jgi:hypothetical protein
MTTENVNSEGIQEYIESQVMHHKKDNSKISGF